MEKTMKRSIAGLRFTIVLAALLLQGFAGFAQQGIIINLAGLDGIELSPDNIFNYQIINNSGGSREVSVKGTVRYKNSALRFSYSYNTFLATGINSISKDRVTNPQWNFPEAALRELFSDYRKLPQGTYEYCVELTSRNNNSEMPEAIPISDCIYQRVNDIFLINLLEPENDAKLYEYYPMLSWAVNYPFASELKYRVRVAELKKGQSHENAITRNNPVYQDNSVLSTSVIYPVTARPLEKFQPYVWTVDAYYKGILLGGAEVWKFTIVEDSLFQALPDQSSYIDINIDEGINQYYAVGNVKLKYSENDFLKNELRVKFSRKGEEIKKGERVWPVSRGENFTAFDLTDLNIRHREEFEVSIEYKNASSDNHKQIIKYRYVNPDLVK